MKIGVLSLQGSVIEHLNCIRRAGAQPVDVKTVKGLQEIDGLILPGGESTTLGILLKEFSLLEPLRKLITDGLPVWGTCAGMILLAKKIKGQENIHLATMDMEVTRNGYGSQLDSFVHSTEISEVSQTPIPLIFIRAPYIERVWSDCSVMSACQDKIVAAKQKNMLATAFHPELTQDLSFYHFFMMMVNQAN